MTAQEKRNSVRDLYKQILGRNIYSQNAVKRQCVYHKYSDGKYYSDCSSSILNTYKEAGILKSAEGNTASIHYNWQKVDVKITDGIPDESVLRVGDAFMYAGSDPSRPLQIGHVEMYVGNSTLYGHGSGTPSKKDMVSYCKNRWSQKAQNGVRKGLVEVRRYIADDQVENAIEGNLEVLGSLNYRSTPDSSGTLLGTFHTGDKIVATKKCNKWFYVPEVKGWCSAKYLKGWIRENHKWWYLLKDYTWYASVVTTIDGNLYAFDPDGWMITSDRIGSDGSIK